VLSLDTLRALGKGGALEALHGELERKLAAVRDPGLVAPAEAARAGFRHAVAWARAAMGDAARLEAGARRLAMTLGRSVALALLTEHAQWCVDQSPGQGPGHRHGPRLAAAARRFARTGVDQIADADLDDTRLLVAPV